jgi:tRNA threonylcarbamoyladenosine modification (KEOPS) complex  Pcc1 subunit
MRCVLTPEAGFLSLIEEEKADRGSIKIKAGKVIIDADDAIALRAGTNSMLRLLVTYEKMKAI